MPIIKAQKKSVRQSAKRRVFNDRRRRTMRETIKALKDLVANKDQKAAAEMLPATYKAIDKAAKRKVIAPNAASRKKAQMARIVKELS